MKHTFAYHERSFGGTICRPVVLSSLLFGLFLSFQPSNLLFANPVTWGTTLTVEPNDVYPNTWMRLLHLQDGSWLAATSLNFGNPNSTINVRRSTDDCRTWTLLTSISESGRDLDNPVLAQLPNGTVLLSVRSIINDVSAKIEVWTSTNVLTTAFTQNAQLVDDLENPNSTNCPDDTGELCGVWEPNLTVRPDGSVLIFYSDESMQQQGYDQVIDEKVSTNGGQTWGAKSVVVSLQDNASRPGMPYLTVADNGQYILSYEVINNPNQNAGYKTSSDGVTWTAGLGTNFPYAATSNFIIQSFANGMLIATANSYNMYYSGDYGNTWTSMSNGLSSGSWGSMFQTRTNEIGIIYGATLCLGTMAPLPYHDAFASNAAPDFTTYGGTWSASSGVYTDSNAGSGDKAVMVGNTSGGISGYASHWRDYTLQADVRLHSTSNSDAGVVIRASNSATGTDAGDSYYVGATSTGTVVLGSEANGWTQLQSASIPGGVPANTWIHLRVTAANCAIIVTAQQLGSTSQANFTYNDSSCLHMNGSIGLRTYLTAADWQNVTAVQTGPTPNSAVSYIAPFASGSTSGWTTYNGSWSLASGVYSETLDDMGDKSIVFVTNNGNLMVQSDIDLTSPTTNSNSGVLFGVSNPADGTDSLDGFFVGTSTSNVFLGYESYGWTSLTSTPFESTYPGGTWVHVTGQARGCRLLIAAQRLTQTYGYLQTYIYPSCTTTGSQGVRQFNSPTGFANFSVVSN